MKDAGMEVTSALTQFATMKPIPRICCVKPTMNPRILGGAISVYLSGQNLNHICEEQEMNADLVERDSHGENTVINISGQSVFFFVGVPDYRTQWRSQQ